MSTGYGNRPLNEREASLVKNGGAGEIPPLSEAQFPPRPPRLAFSVRETAQMLGVCEKTVHRLVARRLLHPSRALRHLLISQKEVERFLEDTADL